jgi:type II secretory pathway predicted ATPase ExeA
MTELDLVRLRDLAAELGFSPSSTDEAYIEAHRRHNNNGRSDTLFSDDAIELIHNASRGHPRAVNNLALHALTAAFAADHAIVDEKAARIAIAEITAD